MGRAPCCEKVGLKKGRWTAEEDEILTKYIQANGEGSWRSLPKNAGLLRCGKSCRLRWINYLRADLKRGNISAEDEDIIIKLHASMGNRWSLIASHMPGRTDNEIKNYWNSHLCRKITTFRRPETLPIMLDLAKVGMASKRKGGKTSRWAMKKNKSHTKKGAKISTEKPKGSESSNEAIPSPSTPALEKETLSSALNESMVLEAYVKDKERMHIVVPSTYQNGEGMLGSSEERESMQVLCPTGEDERASENPMLYPIVEKESEKLGPYEGIDGGVLCFDDIMDSGLLDPNDVLTSSNEESENDAILLSEERESGVLSSTKMATSDDQESGIWSCNGESGDWYSISSIPSCFDDDKNHWDWESIVQGNELRDEQENLISWLWESNNGEVESHKLGEMDYYEKENAMVSWLLS